MVTEDLFTPSFPGLHHLPGFAADDQAALIETVGAIAGVAPFRQMLTPGGRPMSVTITNAGAAGWVSDRHGYRYSAADPQTGLAWPAMPVLFEQLAGRAAAQAGFEHFIPDACLINRYEPGAKMTLHQDRDERDFLAPIVSVSLGLPAVFLWGGAERRDRAARIPVFSGDVLVWGGVQRLFFHGILPLADGVHPLCGRTRLNFTFRKAL
jgi:alkylated DNA repair protein (DNA oxidative demethylase)